MTKGSDHIPDHIHVDILLKLPASSLLRFKRVCEIWYSLISDPLFINLHSKRPPTTQLSPRILIATNIGCELQFQLLDYERPSFDYSCLSNPINFPMETFKRFKVVGSCYGLVCVEATNYFVNNFYILNPLTKECRKVPKILDGYSTSRRYFHGLGYDSVANDFKFVISWDGIKWNNFSLKKNSWKIIKSNNIQNSFEDPSVYYHFPLDSTLATIVNGMLYWIGVSYRPKDPAFIVAFDVAKETVETSILLLPEYVPWEDRKSGILLEHGGCLCVSFLNLGSYRKIWMMKEYATWVHFLTVKVSPPFDSNCLLRCLFISITRNEVVCHTGSNKFSSSGRLKKDQDEIILQQDVNSAVLYVETFISPLQLAVKG